MGWLDYVTPTVCERFFGAVATLGTFRYMSFSSPLATVSIGKALLGAYALSVGYACSRIGYNVGVFADYVAHKCGIVNEDRKARIQNNQQHLDFILELPFAIVSAIANLSGQIIYDDDHRRSMLEHSNRQGKIEYEQNRSWRQSVEHSHRMSMNSMRHEIQTQQFYNRLDRYR